MTELVFNKDGQTITNSLLVAQKFGKRHTHVLDAIRKIIKDSNEAINQPAENWVGFDNQADKGSVQDCAVLSMFVETQYIDEKGEERPVFIMNRDGFSLLVMGFTGKNAMKFKLEFIGAFNEMERKLNVYENPKTQLEVLQQTIGLMVEQEKKMSLLETKIETVESKVDNFLQKAFEAEAELKALPVATEIVPEMVLRDKIRLLVNRYCSATGLFQQVVWDNVYQTLLYNYHVSIKSCAKINKNESWLDVAERKNHLDKIYIIVSNMLREKGMSAN